MSKQREALELALEALQWNWGGEPLPTMEIEAIEALKRALAEPEPVSHHSEDDLDMVINAEPVAWMLSKPDRYPAYQGYNQFSFICDAPWDIPLYTAPPARKPLTDEDISAIVQSMSSYTWDAHMLARAIERAHGITND